MNGLRYTTSTAPSVRMFVATNSQAFGSGQASTPRGITGNEVPPNKWMERTAKSVTPFAYAKAAPLFPAAHPRR